MTAAELASFRTLLQAQAPSPPAPDRGLFARMRARLTVVERSEPFEAPPPRKRPALAPPRLATVAWEAADVRVADPPRSIPPVFGRRETGAGVEVVDPPVPALTAARGETPERVAVRLRRSACLDEAHATPDELAAERPSPRPVDTPAPGSIAGWSRSRPASAQRRILQRLEAVFTAELEGLDARIAADSPAR